MSNALPALTSAPPAQSRKNSAPREPNNNDRLRAGVASGPFCFRKRMKPLAEQFYDDIAARYDDVYFGKSPYWRFYNQITWRHIRTHIPPDQSAECLDLGCGTGYWGLRLAKSGYRVTLSDISQKMIEVAKRKAEETEPTPRVEFLKADICDLSALASDRFGLVTAQGDPISCCSSPPAAIREIFRVLKPKAVAVLSVDNRMAGIDHFLKTSDVAGLELFLKTGMTEWLAHDRSRRFPIKYFTPDELRSVATKAGFEVLDLVGKIILPLREYESALEDEEEFRRLIKIEEKLHREESALGRASHLEIVVRKPCPSPQVT